MPTFARFATFVALLMFLFLLLRLLLYANLSCAHTNTHIRLFDYFRMHELLLYNCCNNSKLQQQMWHKVLGRQSIPPRNSADAL